MMQSQAIDVTRRETMYLAAGVGAGIAAALGSVGLQHAMGVRIAPLPEIAWSAFVAGIAGGLLYRVLARFAARPVLALWVVSLGIATLDNLLIALLPLPGGHEPHLGIPIDGLLIPLRQMGALAGFGHFAARFFPAGKLPADMLMHYVPAVAVAALVPWLADFRGLTHPHSTPDKRHQEQPGSVGNLANPHNVRRVLSVKALTNWGCSFHAEAQSGDERTARPDNAPGTRLHAYRGGFGHGSTRGRARSQGAGAPGERCGR